jgi:hypothetical protein
MANPAKRGPQMATSSAAAAHRAEVDYLSRLLDLREIETIVVDQNGDRFMVDIVVPDKNFDLEAQIFELQREAMASFPDSRFDFRVFVRRGRDPEDVLSTTGRLVLKKTA